MAGVQIPELSKMDPAPGPTFQEAPTQVADQTGRTQAIEKGAYGLANEAADYEAKVQQHAMEVAGVSAVNQYEVTRRAKLAEAKKHQGNPTQIYRQIDESRDQDQQDILDQYPSASPRLQQLIKEKFNIADTSLQEKQATQHGIQFENWKNKETAAADELDSQKMLDSASFIKADDSSTLAGLQENVNSIIQRQIKLNPEGAVRKEDGTYDISPVLQMQIKQKLSKGLSGVIKTFNNAGQTEESQAVMDAFGDHLLASDRVKLQEGHKDAQLNNKALAEMDKITHKFQDPKDQFDAAENISDLAVREATRKKLSTRQAEAERADNNSKKKVLNDMVQYVQSKNFVDYNAMIEDPVIKDQLSSGHLPPKSMKVLSQIVAPPPESNDQAKSKMYDAMFSGKLQGMDPGDLATLKHGLSRKDQTSLDTQYQKANSQSEGVQHSLVTFGGTRLSEMLQEIPRSEGGIKKNLFGKFSDADTKKLLAAKDRFMSTIGSMGTLAPNNINDMEKLVKAHVADFAKTQAFTTIAPAASTSSTTTTAPTTTMPRDDQAKWIKEWRLQKGRAFDINKGDTMQKLQEFIKQQQGG